LQHRFELALGLNKLDTALQIARLADVEHKWKIVGDSAMSAWDFSLAEECFTNAKDFGSLLLLYSSTCDVQGLRRLAEQAKLAGSHNVAFSVLWQLADIDACIDLLVETNRVAESVLFAQTYKPSRASEVARRWKGTLEKAGKGKVARMIGIPPGVEGADEDLFPEWDEYLNLEKENSSVNLIDVNSIEDAETAAPVNGTSGQEH